jgi:hypothetical protein
MTSLFLYITHGSRAGKRFTIHLHQTKKRIAEVVDGGILVAKLTHAEAE